MKELFNKLRKESKMLYVPSKLYISDRKLMYNK